MRSTSASSRWARSAMATSPRRAILASCLRSFTSFLGWESSAVFLRRRGSCSTQGGFWNEKRLSASAIYIRTRRLRWSKSTRNRRRHIVINDIAATGGQQDESAYAPHGRGHGAGGDACSWAGPRAGGAAG